MRPETKFTLTNVSLTLGILGSAYAFGVWSGTFWVTLDDFETFKIAIAQEHDEHDERDKELSEHQALDDLRRLQAKSDAEGGLDNVDFIEYCKAAETLDIHPEGC